MKKKTWLILLPILLVIVLVVVVFAYIRGGETYMADEKVYIDIAAREMESMGVSLREGRLRFDQGNELWKKAYELCYKDISDYEILNEFEYQVVYYEPKRVQFGGSIWFFIDKEAKQMVMTFREK